MPITVTLEGEDEARVSALVDAAVFPSALAAVQGALKLAATRVVEGPLPDDGVDGPADAQPR